MSNLKQRTINGMAWSISERVGLQVIHMLISIILARLLDPSEFGLIGMLAIFTSIAKSILDSGFGSALIQKKDATQTDSSSIFYFNLLIGFILAGIFFFSAPVIANFYNQPILKPITRILSLNMIINAFGIVHFSILRKKMEFKNHFIVSITAVIISGLCGIIAAFKGIGVWSLVIQSLSLSLAQTVLLWLFNKWRPVGHFSLDSLKTMFSFGSKLLIADLMDMIFRNVHQTFIGKIYEPSDVGYYSQATTMETAATVATSMALGQVIFPAFSPYQNDNSTLKQMHGKIIKMSMFLHTPLMIGLIVIAEPLILVLLTDKWANSIPYFQLLSIVGLFYPIRVQNYNLFRIKGRSDLILKLSLIRYALTAIALALTYKHGILALIYGQIVVVVLSQIIASHMAGRLIKYGLFELIKALIPSMAGALVIGIIVFLLGKINIENILIKLSVQISAGILIYYLINKLLKSAELMEFISISRNLLQNLILKIKGILCKNH